MHRGLPDASVACGLLAVLIGLASPLGAQSPDRGGPGLEQSVKRAVTRGVSYLVETQDLDGSWRYMAPLYRGGQTSLSLLALLEAGVAPHHHTVRLAREFLEGPLPTTTYEAAIELQTRALLPGGEPRLRALAELLTSWMDDGGFDYPGRGANLTTTQYGVLGLAAAEERGIPTRAKTWAQIASPMIPARAARATPVTGSTPWNAWAPTNRLRPSAAGTGTPRERAR